MKEVFMLMQEQNINETDAMNLYLRMLNEQEELDLITKNLRINDEFDTIIKRDNV